jgi:predicted secreted protein
MRAMSALIASIAIAAMALPAHAETAPIKGAVKGTAQVGKGVVKGAGQAGAGVARGTGTAVKSTGRGLWCILTLGNRC